MLDYQLFQLIIPIMESAQPGAGIPNVDGGPGVLVYQANQPTQQGVPSTPGAFLYIISHKPTGFPSKTNVWDEVNSVMVHTELQQYETTFQISFLSTQDPNQTTQYTAGDLANLFRYILQSDATIMQLEANNVGILRVTDVRNPYFDDDRGRFEASANFDFVLTHKQIVSGNIPVLQSEEIDIYQV